MNADVENTSIQISKKRLNGLEFKARTNEPKTNKAYLLETILKKAGIPELSDIELESKLKEVTI